MPHYDNGQAGGAPRVNAATVQGMPNFKDLLIRLQMRRQMEQQRNPGARPEDAEGLPMNVEIPGEDPIRAQPVSGPLAQLSAPSGAPPPGVGVRVGEPVMQMPPMTIPVNRQRPALDRARIEQMLAEKRIDPRMAQMLLARMGG
jgi:hypothetical protein